MEQIPILNEERIETKTPEAELWRAVIDQAIDDLSDPDLGEAAVEWFTSVSEQPTSFRWVCHHLDLNASAVWSALVQRTDWKNRGKIICMHRREQATQTQQSSAPLGPNVFSSRKKSCCPILVYAPPSGAILRTLDFESRIG
jgi:hypothetical protein